MDQPAKHECQGPWAHTKTDVHGNLRPEVEWEPLFTPFGDDPETECLGMNGGPCPKCEAMDPPHGHLNKVAWWAGRFAAEMFPSGSDEANAAGQWGWPAGLWHDLGKFAPEWQDYLRKRVGVDVHGDEITGKVDHSTAGAQHADVAIPAFGRALAYLLAGHHAGLADGIAPSSACPSSDGSAKPSPGVWPLTR